MATEATLSSVRIRRTPWVLRDISDICSTGSLIMVPSELIIITSSSISEAPTAFMQTRSPVFSVRAMAIMPLPPRVWVR